jgi:hypothetical protein
MHLAQDRDLWRAAVSTVMNFGFHKKAGNFLTSCVTASQEGLCSMEFVNLQVRFASDCDMSARMKLSVSGWMPDMCCSSCSYLE